MNEDYEIYLENLYHSLIKAHKHSRKLVKYRKKTEAHERQVLKEKGKQTVLSGLIIKLERDFNKRIHGDRYFDTLEPSQKQSKVK